MVTDAEFNALKDRVAALEKAAGGKHEPKPSKYPIEVFKSKYGWKVTLSTGAKEIKPPEVNTYSDGDFYYSPAADAAMCIARHGDGTTDNSKNSRTEGRELFDWVGTEGRHALDVCSRVDAFTAVRQHIVLAQIHGGKDDVTTFRREGSKLWVTKGDDTHWQLVDEDLRISDTMKVGFAVNRGVCEFIYENSILPFRLEMPNSKCYFKAGNYLQSNKKTAPTEVRGAMSAVAVSWAVATHG